MYRMEFKTAIPLLLWLAADFLSVNASGHYFIHQYRQIIPALALCAGCGISTLLLNASKEKLTWLLGAAAFTVLLASSLEAFNGHYKGRANLEDAVFYQLAMTAQKYSGPEEYVYFYTGSDTATNSCYTYAKRLPASRYLFPFLTGGRVKEVLADFSRHSPRVIVSGNQPQWLEDYIKTNAYVRQKDIGGYQIVTKPVK